MAALISNGASDQALRAFALMASPSGLGPNRGQFGSGDTMPDATLIPLNDTSAGPLICFSHLRWDFVLQRPQHLMGRFARTRPVYIWEEPVRTAYDKAFFELH